MKAKKTAILFLILLPSSLIWANPLPPVQIITINAHPPQIGVKIWEQSIDLSGAEIVTRTNTATINQGVFGYAPDTLILDSTNTSGFAFGQEGDRVQIPSFWEDVSWGNNGYGSDAIYGHSLQRKPCYFGHLIFGYTFVFDFATADFGFTDIIINEVNAHGDWGSGSNFIELYNNGNSDISLAGWKIVCDAVYELPHSAVIRPHKFYIIDSEKFPPDFHMDYLQDNIYLIDADSQIVDQVGWSSDHGADISFMRYPDGNADSSSDMHDFSGFNDETSTSFSDGFPSRRAFNRVEDPGLKIIGIDATVQDTLVNIYWSDPVWQTVYSESILRKSTGGFPQTPTDGDLIYEGTDQQFLGDIVTPGTTTYYTVFARTGCGQYSTPDSESQISVYLPSTGIDGASPLPKDAGYLACYPNPFNATTLLTYRLANAGRTEISIYNLIGQKVANLFEGNQSAGEHSVIWNAGNFPSGVYFARLETAGKYDSKKLILLK